MDTQKLWNRFIKSGKIGDYLVFVNSCKEKEIIEGCSNKVYNQSFGYKGNGNRGE